MDSFTPVAVLRAPKRRVLAACTIGLGVPVLVGLVVPHDVTPVGIARTPMLFAVVIATLLGGLAVGAIAAVVAALASAYWFVEPYESFRAKSSEDLLSLLLFVTVSFAAIALVRVLVGRARREAEQRGRTEAQLDAERDAVETLQYALLPSELPTVAGVAVAARYVGATRRDLLGGDWYVVLPVHGDCLVLAVGDVTGHGIEATAAMAELRFATKAFTLVKPSPRIVLEQLNGMLLRSSRQLLCSATVGILDPGNRTWTEAVAGHPPSVVRDADGSTRVFTHGHGPMLGVHAHPEFSEHSTPLVEGATLALYTDGLIERPRESLDEGIERLRVAVSSLTHHESIADELLERLAPGGRDDDIVIVTATHIH